MFQTFDPPSSTGATAPRIAKLRAFMAQAKLDALIIPRSDEYNNEYVPACAERLQFISGFTGSAGMAVVTAKAAALFVDGRYTVQAPAEVDGTIFEVKGMPHADLRPWLVAQAKAGRVGFDPRTMTAAAHQQYGSLLAKAGFKLVPTRGNLVDKVWGRDRPAPPDGPVRIHPLSFAGQSSADKLAALQDQLKDKGLHAAVLTAPDSICWLFNIRGSDVAHNPVVLAYAIVPASGKAQLFLDPHRADKHVKAWLAPVARLKPPEGFEHALAELKAGGKKVLVSPGATWAIARAIGRLRSEEPDLCTMLKAIKNAAEIAGSRAAHLRDGVAVTRFLAWLDGTIEAGVADEITAVERLEAFRRETGALKEISFPTISGSGPNGAIVHYRVTRATNRALKRGELFLIDSGGQYEDGTTDITRTVAIGTPTAEMKRRFTLVLKGMIDLTLARFPAGTRGVDLDPLARRALWAEGLNYDHGTGHGVGSYLNVHEGPQSISKAGMAQLKPGMICSNEPGYYKQGAYGIRIENLVLVTEPQTVGGDQPVMGFETLTLAPIDRRLIETALLSLEERAWLDDYHARVRTMLQPHLSSAEKRWLETATSSL